MLSQCERPVHTDNGCRADDFATVDHLHSLIERNPPNRLCLSPSDRPVSQPTRSMITVVGMSGSATWIDGSNSSTADPRGSR